MQHNEAPRSREQQQEHQQQPEQRETLSAPPQLCFSDQQQKLSVREGGETSNQDLWDPHGDNQLYNYETIINFTFRY